MDVTIDLPSNLIPSFARGMEILVVDHDRTSLLNTASMLEQYTFKVTTTEESSVALSLIQEHKDKFKLVMASYNMPDMDCFAFLRKVNMKDIPVIVITPRRSIQDAIKARLAGASYCLDKPLSMDDLKYVWQHSYRKRKRLGVDQTARKAPHSGTRWGPSAASGDHLDGTSHQNIAPREDDNGHNPDNKGKGKAVVVEEEEGLHVSYQQKLSGTQRKRREMEKEPATDDQCVMIDHADNGLNIAPHHDNKGKGKEVVYEEEEEGLRVSYQKQKLSGTQRKCKGMEKEPVRDEQFVMIDHADNGQNIASHDDNGHHHNNKGKGKEVVVEEGGLQVSYQQKKLSGSQRKRKAMEKEPVRDEQCVMIDQAKAAQRKWGKRGKGKEVEVAGEGLQVPRQQQKRTDTRGKRKKMIDDDQEALDGSDHQNVRVDSKNARPKRSKKMRRVDELHGYGHGIVASGDYPHDNKGKDKEVEIEVEALHESTDDQLPQDKGKQIVEESLHEMDGEFMTTDACLPLFLSFETQGNSKQIVEETLPGGKDQHMMTDAERKGKQIEGESENHDGFASLLMIDYLKDVDGEGESYGRGEQSSREQEKLDTNKTNGQKGKEVMITEAREEEEEPVSADEEEKETARLAARAEDKGKGISEAADSEEHEGGNNVFPAKKPRLRWTPELHHRFKTAIEALGKKDMEVGPRSIHRMMNVPDLSHRQIASHLQKYKARLQRERMRSNNVRSPLVSHDNERSPSVSSNSGRYPYPYSPNPEVSKALKKSREIVVQLTREMSNNASRGHAYGFPRTPNFLTADFSTTDSRLSNNQVPLTPAIAAQRLNSSSMNVITSHPFNATSLNNMNQKSDVNATLNPNPGNVANIWKFPLESKDGNWDSGVMTISDPTSANVPKAVKYLTDLGPGNIQADILKLWNTPASSSLPNAEERPIRIGYGSQKSNVGAITNRPRDLVPKTTLYSKESSGANQELDALAISNPTRGNVSGIGSLVINSTDRMEELDFADNLLNLDEFPMHCNKGKQAAEVMASLHPAFENMPYADKFSVTFNDDFQGPKAMASANPAPGYAQYASNYRMDSATGNQEPDTGAVSSPPVCLPNPNQPHSEFPGLLRLLEEDSFDIEGVDAELNPWDVDRYCKSLRNVLDGSGQNKGKG